jgi:hypothetical protein
VQNTGNDGTGASSGGAGMGSAQAAINLAVTGTVVEPRTFFAPASVTANVLKGAVPMAIVTSNNVNPDSNHATTVKVNGATVNSGSATAVPLPVATPA